MCQWMASETPAPRCMGTRVRLRAVRHKERNRAETRSGRGAGWSGPPATESAATESAATRSPAMESPSRRSPATESLGTRSPATGHQARVTGHGVARHGVASHGRFQLVVAMGVCPESIRLRDWVGGEPAECLAGSLVELGGDGGEVVGVVDGQVGAFGEVLAEQAVGVLVGSTLPG